MSAQAHGIDPPENPTDELAGAVTLARHAAAATAEAGSTGSGGAGDGIADLLGQIAFAAKVVAREARRAALVGRVGATGTTNASGDAQKQLDLFANRVFLRAFAAGRDVAAVVSEELEEPRLQRCDGPAPYLLAIDPVDGSGNVEAGTSIGTIFGVHRRMAAGPCEDAGAEILSGAPRVAAGYVLYGPATVLVYTLGARVDGFTLDPSVGEFLLSHPDVRCPEHGETYSVNTGNSDRWSPAVRRFVEGLNDPGDPDGGARHPYSLRYSGALVADLHRILLEGGIYCYPADREHPEGKIRLLYEAAPLAFLVEAAGGAASNGRGRLLGVAPESLHQPVPLALGSRREVAAFEKLVSREAA